MHCLASAHVCGLVSCSAGAVLLVLLRLARLQSDTAPAERTIRRAEQINLPRRAKRLSMPAKMPSNDRCPRALHKEPDTLQQSFAQLCTRADWDTMLLLKCSTLHLCILELNAPTVGSGGTAPFLFASQRPEHKQSADLPVMIMK